MATGGGGGVAGSIRAGQAFVEMGLDSRQLKDGLADARMRMQAFGATLAGVGASIAGFGESVFSGLRGLFSDAVGHAANLRQLAQQVGDTTENVSQLAFAMESAGIMQEEFTFNVKSLQKELSAAADLSNEAGEKFRRMGLDARKLMNMPLRDQMTEIATAIGEVPNAADRAAAAINFFGRNGTRVLKLFAGGAKEVNDRMDVGARLGATITDEQGEQAFQIQKAWNQAAAALKFGMMEVGRAFFPQAEGIKELTRQFVELVITVRTILTEHKFLIILASKLAVVLVGVGAAMGAAGVGIGLLAAAGVAIPAAFATALVVLKALAVGLLVLGGVLVGIAVHPVTLLSAAFFALTEDGRGLAGFIRGTLLGTLDYLKNVAVATWTGMAHALQRGDVLAAFKILLGGLKVAASGAFASVVDVWGEGINAGIGMVEVGVNALVATVQAGLDLLIPVVNAGMKLAWKGVEPAVNLALAWLETGINTLAKVFVVGVNALVQGVVAGINLGVNLFTGYLNLVIAGVNGLIGVLNAVREWGIAPWIAIKGGLVEMYEYYLVVWGGIKDTWSALSQILSAVWGAFVDVWKGTLEGLRALWGAFVEALKVVWPPVVTFISKLWAGVSQFIVDKFDWILVAMAPAIAALAALWAPIVALWEKGFAEFVISVREMFTDLAAFIKSAMLGTLAGLLGSAAKVAGKIGAKETASSWQAMSDSARGAIEEVEAERVETNRKRREDFEKEVAAAKAAFKEVPKIPEIPKIPGLTAPGELPLPPNLGLPRISLPPDFKLDIPGLKLPAGFELPRVGPDARGWADAIRVGFNDMLDKEMAKKLPDFARKGPADNAALTRSLADATKSAFGGANAAMAFAVGDKVAQRQLRAGEETAKNTKATKEALDVLNKIMPTIVPRFA